MLKYLRIAVTALSLTACVLLVALWERFGSEIEPRFTPRESGPMQSKRR
jgi:hypothetical protein